MFEQQPGAHIRQRQGCPKCGIIRIGKLQQIGNDKFIERIEKIFGKNIFDYSKLNYQGAHKDVTLICKKCNNVETKVPNVWYRGFGCLKCQGNIIGKKLLTNENFIERSKQIHGDKYDYSKVVYTGISNKIEIICPKHGSFFQEPNVHVNMKCNCPECNITKGEEAISIWLNNRGIKYIFQHKIMKTAKVSKVNSVKKQNEKFEKQINFISEIKAELLSKRGNSINKPKITFYEGDEGLIKVYEDTLTSSGIFALYFSIIASLWVDNFFFSSLEALSVNPVNASIFVFKSSYTSNSIRPSDLKYFFKSAPSNNT